MADNVGYTPGAGATVAADEINSVLYQRIKPTFGGDGQATDVSIGNPLPVFDDRVENLISLLERLVKISESSQVVDSAQRQRVTLDSITAALTLANITTVSTVTAVTNMTQNAGMDREQYINIAKQTYTNSIRNRLNIV